MSSTVKDMLATYPADLGGIDRAGLTRCIEECMACAQACTACADACLSEDMVGDLAKCVRTDMDCADVCNATAAVLSRRTGYDATVTAARAPSTPNTFDDENRPVSWAVRATPDLTDHGSSSARRTTPRCPMSHAASGVSSSRHARDSEGDTLR
ncbi:hypothetical protein [Streptomyces sp. NPDC001744]|uniref:hypothetical protein n=1 Tax=Streptomyces sp. NPDC001744 TaxID=3364606 RepID=UPI003684FBE5